MNATTHPASSFSLKKINYAVQYQPAPSSSNLPNLDNNTSFFSNLIRSFVTEWESELYRETIIRKGKITIKMLFRWFLTVCAVVFLQMVGGVHAEKLGPWEELLMAIVKVGWLVNTRPRYFEYFGIRERWMMEEELWSWWSWWIRTWWVRLIIKWVDSCEFDIVESGWKWPVCLVADECYD